jgi:hypothetical protein
MTIRAFLLFSITLFFVHQSLFAQIPVTDVAQASAKSTNAGTLVAHILEQSAGFAATLAKGIEQYNKMAEIYRNGVQIYETGKAAVDIANRVAGDLKGMTDLQSYQMMFSRLQQQELIRIHASAVPLINFNQAYQNSIAKYLAPEGSINFFALAKSYSQDPNVGYSKILVQMTNMNRAQHTYACQSYETEAKALENKALLYEQEAQYVHNLLSYSNMGVSMDKLFSSGATLDNTFKTNAFSNTFGSLSKTVNSSTQSLIKKEMDSYASKNQKEITPQTTDQLMVRFRGLQKQALFLRNQAVEKRSLIWSHCGPKEVMAQIKEKQFYTNMIGGSTSDL